jgi:uncharacterized protein (TIGR03437 family)
MEHTYNRSHLFSSSVWLLGGLIAALPLWPQNISTVAGNSSWGRPITVRLDAAGNIYTTDFDNHVVYKVDSTGAPTIVAGTYKKAGATGDGGLATSATLNGPAAVAPAADGTLYICEYTGNRIRKVDTKGIITTFVGPTAGFSGDGGQASSATIRNPLDIIVDSGGNIWFVDSNNNRIRKITPAGIINTVAGFGTAAYSGDGASALQAGMQPGAMTLGPNGSFYFTDAGVAGQGGSYRVRMVAGNGIISTIAGGKGLTDSGDGGPATSAGLSSPDGVAIDSAGNVYIAEAATNKIRKVSPGGTITTYAGTGGCCSTGDGGAALQATFNYPRGMTVDPANNLYVADSNSDKIRKISGAPAILSNGLVNGASFTSGGIVPGEIATIFGANLTTGTGINLAAELPLATTLLGVQVLVNGTAAPIFAVDNVNGQEQINFQVPYEVAGQGSTATIQVVDNGSPGNSITVPVLASQPGMFTYTVGSTTYGAILHANYQLANTASPAAAGETVQIYCTGLGAVSPTPADGVAAAGASMTTATATVTIGGASASVGYAGLAPGFVGLYQVNAQVPAGLTSGNQPVIITIGGAQSAIALLPVM